MYDNRDNGLAARNQPENYTHELEYVRKGMTSMNLSATRMVGKHVRATKLAASLLASLMVVFASSALHAQNSWKVSISEKEMKLENPVDMAWDKWLMWDLGYERMMCRNAPYIELLNEATSSSPITEFHLTIGDNRFNFGPVEGTDLVMLGSTTPGFPLSANTVGNLGDELVVSIGNGGLLPGQAVRFKIKLNVDPSFAAQYAASFGASLPDYRTVLFDMNGLNVYDGVVNTSTADNAHTFVIFNPGGKSGTAVFADETVAAGQYYNNNLRAYSAIDPVLIFQTGGGQEVPEPCSVGLVMLGLSAGLLVRRARRPAIAG
jgi:hypothetical protein